MTAQDASFQGRTFVFTFLATVVLTLAPVLGWLAFMDPYWIWRESPPWIVDGATANENLDNKMRFVKALRAAQQDADIVWVGSSRVYRGVDVGEINARTFNLGVAGMMLDEVQTYIRLARDRVRPQLIVVQLDYFMFGQVDRAAPIDPAAHTLQWQTKARMQSLISLQAITDAVKLPTKEASSDGRWMPNGFKQTVPRPASYTTLVQNGLRLDRVHTEPRLLNLLPEIFDEARRSGISFKFYIGPESDAYLSLIRRDGSWGDFMSWRAYVADTARRYGVDFIDLAEAHPFPHFDWANGSTEQWIDAMHFGPTVGRFVGGRLGLPIKPAL